MSTAPRFSLRAAVTDSVSTGRREAPETVTKGDVTTVPEKPAVQSPQASLVSKTKRAATREGARGVTVWVEPEVYRMIKLIGLDMNMTTQDVMMEAINDLFAKKGKGRIAKA